MAGRTGITDLRVSMADAGLAPMEFSCDVGVAGMKNKEARVSRSSAAVLRQLSSAVQEKSEMQKDYRSGAVYKGEMSDNKRSGQGLFLWPDGARYEGEFVENSRHGHGVQTWRDGSRYEGTFSNDTKHGSGFHLWSNGENFEGEFFKDRCHGRGVYSWPNCNRYEGTFYTDRKEGYGTFTFPDGVKFEGLYKSDERTGPGVLSYPDGRQDVGLWFRERLIKLCFPVEGAFALKNCEEYENCTGDNPKYVMVEGVHSQHDLVQAIIGETPELFCYDSKLSSSDLAKELLLDVLPVGCTAADLASFDEAFFDSALSSSNGHPENIPKESLSGIGPVPVDVAEVDETVEDEEPDNAHDVAPDNSTLPANGRLLISEFLDAGTSWIEINGTEKNKSVKIEGKQVVAWNGTPSCMRLQAHVLRHQNEQQNVQFDVSSILQGSRGRHGDRGPIETLSEQLIMLAAKNDLKAVERMLHDGDVNADVADVNGHTALIGATVNMHKDIINCLLDNGADVNKLTDEGLSALAICVLFLYPPSSFKSIHDEVKTDQVQPAPDQQEPKRNSSSGKGGKKKPVHNVRVEKTDARRIQELKEELERARSQTDGKTSDTASVVSANDDTSPTERKLGTLSFQRVEKQDPETLMTLNPISDQILKDVNAIINAETDRSSPSQISEFDSYRVVRNLPINVTDGQIVKYAEILSRNDMVVSRIQSADVLSEGTVRCLAVKKSQVQQLRETMKLLLKRGADPNASSVPMPALFFAVRSGDVEAVQLLLLKGAAAGARLSSKFDGLSPLHYACLLPGEDGVKIVELLLNALADPDARAEPDDSYLDRSLDDEWRKDVISPRSARLLGGRTALHVACSRMDNYEHASRMVRLLMEHHADTSLLCNGHTALSLAITSGNDLAVAELLRFGINASLPLTHGVGSALCAATLISNEARRKPDDRITLINKLVEAGANMFTPIAIGPKRQMGSVVDYAYYMYSLDRKIANVPYHALAPADRDTFNARHRLLEHLGHLLRQKAVERETKRFLEEDGTGVIKRNPSANFIYTGCGGSLTDASAQCSRRRSGKRLEGTPSEDDIRRPSFHFCYECGRSIGVRLEPCSRCKAVFYCSKTCQNKAWAEVHKDECLRVPGQNRNEAATSASQKNKQRTSSDLKLPEVTGNAEDKVRKGERWARSDRSLLMGDLDSEDETKDMRRRGRTRRPQSAKEPEEEDGRKNRRSAGGSGKSVHLRSRQKKRGVSAKEGRRRGGGGGDKSRGLFLDSDADERVSQRKGRISSFYEELGGDGEKFPPISSKFAERVVDSGVGTKSWKDGLPHNCHIGNYSYI